MAENGDYDSDAPEEFTADQGIQLDQEITKVQKANKARVLREAKERRRLWAQRKTPKPAEDTDQSVQNVSDAEPPKESDGNRGMLSNDIIQLLVAREKLVFSSDSEDDESARLKKASRKKKKPRSSGVDTVVLSEIPRPQCVETSLEFLKKRKMQVARSSAVLKNSNQALRLLTSSGLLK